MPHSLPRPNVVAATARTGAITIVAREQEPERHKYKGIPDKRKTQTTLVKRSLCCSITWSTHLAQTLHCNETKMGRGLNVGLLAAITFWTPGSELENSTALTG